MARPFERVTGVAAPLLVDDVNTDQIAPIQRARSLHPDYGAMLFSRWRRRADGSDDPGFVLNRPQFRDARILVAGRNFGCGSSRDDAVWALTARGISCVVARSFADIYRENCLKNGVLPVVLPAGQAEAFEATVVGIDGGAPFSVDLVEQRITCPDGSVIGFEIAPAERDALLEGLDDIGLTLRHAADIADWETRTKRDHPWLQAPADRRSKNFPFG